MLRITLRKMRKSILDVLFPRTRQVILSAILLRPDKWWYLTDLAKHLGLSPSSLQRELASLVNGDLLISRKDGQRVYYKVNQECPIVEELQTIFVKTSGIADVISSSLKRYSGKIEIAFVYGSVARTEELSTSDVDLMIVGDVGLADLVPGLRRAGKALSREINPTIYSPREFFQKREEGDSFINTVLSDSKIFLKGTDSELEALAR
jgi:DNA-binding transcriptional ArsR family regulator